MVFAVGIRTSADLGGKTLDEVVKGKPEVFLADKSIKEENKQIATAVICAVAAAVFGIVAGFAFAALHGAIAAVGLLTLPAFLPLAIGIIATISVIALIALVVKNSIDAHSNRSIDPAKPEATPENPVTNK